MTTKETSKRSLISSTAAPNQGATRAFALVPWVHRNVDMGRDLLEVNLTRKGKLFKYLEDACTCAIPHVMPIGQVLDGTSTIRKNPDIVP
ncbi:hypothetical protein TNCV_3473791 [Trichonephila clavipes]|nr:hypothetical protein TNCV_3473791 [Trichonephila clavipes]